MAVQHRSSILAAAAGIGTKIPPGTYTGVCAGGTAPMPLPELGLIRFRAVHYPHMGVVCELEADVLAAGFGTLDITDRLGQESITSYHGRSALTLTIPLLFDQFQARGNVEADLTMVQRMLGQDDTLPEPPALIIEGRGVPFSYSSQRTYRWQLNGDPQWDDSDIRTAHGTGKRQYIAATVTATKIVRPTELPAADTGTRHYYTVPASGGARSLRSVGRKFGKDWATIRQLNPSLPADPDKNLPTATKVRYA